MATNKRKRIKTLVQEELTYSEDPGSWVGGDHGIFSYNNGTPVGFDGAGQVIDVIRDGFTPLPDVPGRFLRPYNPTWMLQGSGTEDESPKSMPLFLACAMTLITSSTDAHVYGPVSATLPSASALVDMDGLEARIHGLIGTFTISATAGQAMPVDFALSGLWEKLIDTSEPAFAAFAAGGNLAQPFKNAKVSINNGDMPLWDCATPVDGTGSPTFANDQLTVRSFTFDRGVTTGELPDACLPDALGGLNIEDARPTLQLVLELKNRIDDLINFEEDFKLGRLHDVSLTLGENFTGETFKEWTIHIPQAAVTDAQMADGAGGSREVTVSYLATHTTDNAEFRMTLA